MSVIFREKVYVRLVSLFEPPLGFPRRRLLRRRFGAPSPPEPRLPDGAGLLSVFFRPRVSVLAEPDIFAGLPLSLIGALRLRPSRDGVFRFGASSDVGMARDGFPRPRVWLAPFLRSTFVSWAFFSRSLLKRAFFFFFDFPRPWRASCFGASCFGSGARARMALKRSTKSSGDLPSGILVFNIFSISRRYFSSSVSFSVATKLHWEVRN